MKSLILKYWLYAVLVLQFVLLIGLGWYTQYQLTRHENAILNEATVIQQIVTFINNATKTTQQ